MYKRIEGVQHTQEEEGEITSVARDRAHWKEPPHSQTVYSTTCNGGKSPPKGATFAHSKLVSRTQVRAPKWTLFCDWVLFVPDSQGLIYERYHVNIIVDLRY
eukprot:scaffold301500_cov59-Attheya_sp.AAC.2